MTWKGAWQHYDCRHRKKHDADRYRTCNVLILPGPDDERVTFEDCIMIDFTEEQMERYSRHILLDDVGVEGQEKLLQAKVLIVGAGGLGSPAALYLAAAGIGTIGIIDSDSVEISNLQRQIAHFTKDIGIAKVDSAAEKMQAINPDIKVKTYREYLCAANITKIFSGYDFILDGTDNFPTKFLINDACIFSGIPFSHGGILRFNGQTMTIIPGQTACYRCGFRNPPPPDAVPSCAQAGVLGAVAGMLGTIQAAEALKYITGAGELLTNTLLTFDARTMAFRKIKLNRQESCPLCGPHPEITELIDAEQTVCGLH
jgi:molybdopterin/thiamine biosynthesis adenylyltransferase